MALALSACGGSANGGEDTGEGDVPIVGVGSATQEAAQESWIEGFERREAGAKVSYEPTEPGRGRREFLAGDAAYAASDTPLEGAELRQAVERCRPGQLVEVPAYLSKIKVGIHVGDVGLIALTPRTLARIFAGEIDEWSDPEIRRENTTIAKLLRGPITVVYPAGKSGMTANVTAFLSEAAPGVWRHGSSEAWPVPKGGVAVARPRAVLAAIEAREGAIGFADASWAATLKPVIFKTGSDVSDTAPPDAGSSIVVLEGSPEASELKASPYMLPFDLERPVGMRDVYPLVFTSYLIACTRYESAGEGASVRGFFEYAVGPKGQEAASHEAGSDPLAGELQQRSEAAVRAIE